MSRTTLYVIKEISSSFLLILIILTSITWLTQALRHLDLFSSENIYLGDYLYYILLFLPKISNITLPISLFISIMYTLNRMRADSELLIFWSSGKSNRNFLLSPIIILALILFLFQLILTIIVIPSSSLEIRNQITEIRSGGIDYGVLKEKKFINPVKDLTIFIQDIESENFKGLMIQDEKDELKPTTYIAEKGIFKKIENKSYLVLLNGFMQIFSHENGEISEIEFESYELDLTPYYEIDKKYIYIEERSTLELLSKIKNKVDNSQEAGEFHNRIINPFYIFIIAILPLLTFKIAKRPDTNWTFPIIIVSTITLIIKFYEITMSSILLAGNALILVNYLSPFILILLILCTLYFENKTIE